MMPTQNNQAIRTLIICDGLTNGFVSPDAAFATGKAHIGRQEIDRLLGKGRDYGNGPLPSFLREAALSAKRCKPIGIILLQTIDSVATVHGAPDIPNPLAFEFPSSLKGISNDAIIVKTKSDIVPWWQIGDAIEKLSGQTIDPGEPIGTKLRFLVAGCNTEGRPMAIATYIRNVLQCDDVAVSVHLVGSSAREAHYATLRHTLPAHRVRVILDLSEAARFAGIDPEPLNRFNLDPCAIEPTEICSALDKNRRQMVEALCMHWTRCRLRALAGGFSGSQLFLAEGWKEEARTEPMVLKIDGFSQMNREISGYHQVKDLLGKHIPNFGYPIAIEDDIGVSMELATMDGQPNTFQDCFEAADVEMGFDHFTERFKKALNIISERLYRNTRQSAQIVPYHQLGLNAEKQMRYLKKNVAIIESYLAEMPGTKVPIDFEGLPKILKLITGNDDGVDSEVCIVHGDLNLQNIIYDQVDNIWFIDWTDCGWYPLELDFAKLENDIKFVISKAFDVDDLPRVMALEEYLLSTRMPSDELGLPGHLKFVKWDLRYRKILSAIRLIRSTCFDLKESEDWLVYRIALLKYATHTLSFDKRRRQGECNLQQLVHALYSVQQLLLDLVSDDYHMKIRGERPAAYPPRQRISIDLVPWAVEAPNYSPPYYVDATVLDNDTQKTPNGWADPEDVNALKPEPYYSGKPDPLGRPLHPRGRTGIAGRGLLGRWGANPAVSAVIMRYDMSRNAIEVLLGKNEQGDFLWLPKGFVPKGTEAGVAIRDVITREFGWRPLPDSGEVFFENYSYDLRQTDHAWVETTAFLFCYTSDIAPDDFGAGRGFEEVAWWPVNAETIHKLNPMQMSFVHGAIKRFETKGLIDFSDFAKQLWEDELD